MEAELKQWAAPYGDRVRILTNVKHDDVPGYLNVMDLVAAPSQTTKQWREQFGRMLIEAFACGVCVVASDSGEIPYVVGRCGHHPARSRFKGLVRNHRHASRRSETPRGICGARATAGV